MAEPGAKLPEKPWWAYGDQHNKFIQASTVLDLLCAYWESFGRQQFLADMKVLQAKFSPGIAYDETFKVHMLVKWVVQVLKRACRQAVRHVYHEVRPTINPTCVHTRPPRACAVGRTDPATQLNGGTRETRLPC